MINQQNKIKLYRHRAEDIKRNLDCFNNYAHSLIKPDSGETKIKFINGIIPTPWHGRSQAIFIENTSDYKRIDRGLEKKWIIIKGVGCPYLKTPYLNTNEFEGHIWGMIDENTAKREFNLMEIVYNLNIPTSKPLCLKKLLLRGEEYENISPYLIYYQIENPLRLIDLDFCSPNQKSEIRNQILNLFNLPYEDAYLVVTEIISEIIIKLYKNNIVHNALTTHNITCSLELVDFESSFKINKNDIDYNDKIAIIPRELIQLREIAYSVSWWFQEKYDVDKVDKILSHVEKFWIK